ncbi:MAG: PilT/PilU family type 4a pilus ATPase [Chromatiales bacterium]|nr:PilT/PilU family type 4a pilus ATPase [Chromatiales bacterium]
MEGVTLFNRLLTECVSRGASDLHISSGDRAVFRVSGGLQRQQESSISQEEVEAICTGIMTEHQCHEFSQKLTVDLGYTSTDGERFRVNCYREMGRPAIAVRHLDQQMLSLEQLRLPPQLHKLAYLKSGLVLVTGATGSGKSTTLAALLDEINRNRQCHILTVEDPVEFVHANQQSLVHHRELYSDVPTFADAVRAAMREDPDVIMVGEMRDIETMRAALTAAETGHLVFSTLHTGEAVGAVERLVGSFPGEEQAVARHRIAMSLRAVIAQHLVPSHNGKGRVPAVEVLMMNRAISNLIENTKTRQIYSAMESGANEGMQTLDQALADLIRKNLISRELALSVCHDDAALDRLIRLAGAGDW